MLYGQCRPRPTSADLCRFHLTLRGMSWSSRTLGTATHRGISTLFGSPYVLVCLVAPTNSTPGSAIRGEIVLSGSGLGRVWQKLIRVRVQPIFKKPNRVRVRSEIFRVQSESESIGNFTSPSPSF